MRWADLDSLDHVNNVVYVAYAREVQGLLVADGVLAPGLPVRRCTVEFLRPVHLSSTPLAVTSTLDGDVLVQEIAPDLGEAVHCRVTTEFGNPVPAEPGGSMPATYRCTPRLTDVGASGHVDLRALFEWAQEARIAAFSTALERVVAGRFVLARLEVAPGGAIAGRREPYELGTAVTRIGGASFTMTTLVDGGRLGRADAVLVGFDLPNERSRPLDDAERAGLARLTPAG